MQDVNLFAWWAGCISGGSVFLTIVSIYLYANSRQKRKEPDTRTESVVDFVKGFIFVWVLLGLLVFYIVSIHVGSAMVFASGNVIVEAILVAYLIRNRTEKSEEL